MGDKKKGKIRKWEGNKMGNKKKRENKKMGNKKMENNNVGNCKNEKIRKRKREKFDRPV